MMWWISAGIALAALVIHHRGPNAVWGTTTFAVPVGLVIALIQPGFDWSTVGKVMIVGTFLGLFFEYLPRLFQK